MKNKWKKKKKYFKCTKKKKNEENKKKKIDQKKKNSKYRAAEIASFKAIPRQQKVIKITDHHVFGSLFHVSLFPFDIHKKNFCAKRRTFFLPWLAELFLSLSIFFYIFSYFFSSSSTRVDSSISLAKWMYLKLECVKTFFSTG